MDAILGEVTTALPPVPVGLDRIGPALVPGRTTPVRGLVTPAIALPETVGVAPVKGVPLRGAKALIGAPEGLGGVLDEIDVAAERGSGVMLRG